MKSTPIVDLETIIGLQSLGDRRDYKMLNQAAKPPCEAGTVPANKGETKLAWLPAYTPQTTKLKQSPENSSSQHRSQHSCLSQCYPSYGCLVYSAGPSVK